MNNIVITKTNGGLGRRNPSKDGVSGLLANGVSIVGGAQLNTVYKLGSESDALSLLIDESYDTSNGVLVYEHIKEFFRINPDGTLYLMLLPQNTSYKDMLDPTIAANGVKLINEALGEIRQLAVAYNPTLAGNWTDVDAAIINAQALADYAYNNFRPLNIILEGRYYDVANPVNLRLKNAKNVSVMIGQNLTVANNTSNPQSTYASVGTILGAVSKASVNENIGWVEKFNVSGGGFNIAGIQGTAITSISQTSKDTLNDYGLIFFRTFVGFDGIYINDSHTCEPLTSDYAYIENNRTIDKAVREIRAYLLPKLNSPIDVDADTGKLSPEVVKSFETLGKKALELMASNGEVSDFDIYIDPSQDVLGTSELKVQFTLVPTGTARKISVTIGFSNPFN